MLTRLAIECAGGEGAVACEVRKIFQGFVDMIAALLAEAKKQGEVRDELPVLPFAQAMIGALLGLAAIGPLLAHNRMSYTSMEEILRPVVTRGISR